MNRYEALKHAAIAHAGQVDKCGKPYILHPIAVAGAVEHTEMVRQEIAVEMALLHDVWEDTDHVLPGLTQRQERILGLLTRHPAETYAEYIAKICEGRFTDLRDIAAIVKLADLWHNLQPERQACLPSKEAASLLEGRYLKARDRIWEALGFEWWPTESEEGRC